MSAKEFSGSKEKYTPTVIDNVGAVSSNIPGAVSASNILDGKRSRTKAATTKVMSKVSQALINKSASKKATVAANTVTKKKVLTVIKPYTEISEAPTKHVFDNLVEDEGAHLKNMKTGPPSSVVPSKKLKVRKF